MIIDSFRGEYGFLSNYYECKVYYHGITFKNSEAAFQAMKCLTDEEMLSFRDHSAPEAKRHGQIVKLRPDWEKVKRGIMKDIVRAKFVQNVGLAKKLVATGDAELIEGNTWGDTYWGFDTREKKGENHLGKILMALRSELARMNTPQFVIRSSHNGFEAAFSNEKRALAMLKERQEAEPHHTFELRREYPYADSALWNPHTSSWIA